MPPALPTGTESVRPFLPAMDFANSKTFYEALGFPKELDGDDAAAYRMGATSSLLQNQLPERVGGELHDAASSR